MQMQSQDNMSDIMASYNFMNQLQQHFLDQSELVYEPIRIYPDLPLVFTNTNKFDEIVSFFFKSDVLCTIILISDF